MTRAFYPSNRRPMGRNFYSPCKGLALLVIAISFVGCSTTFYRRQADKDAYRLTYEKSLDTVDGPQDFSVYVDPRSRMFDPYDPDHEPMPPDDPAAHQLMHYIDHKKGWKHWDKNGHTPLVENPDWMCFLHFDEDGCVPMSSDDAVLLALLNSRNYQSQLEELYLSALDVSFERFRFDSQFFWGQQIQYTADGPMRRGAGGESSSELLVATLPATQEGIRMQRMFATGGEMVIGLANSLVWEFSGPDMHTATTLANMALVQPLLRNGGKAVVLERLTIAERQLLANVRAMERFRRGFYVEVMTGEGGVDGPSRRGGVFGGAGLEGFSGVGGGGFGRLTGGGGGGIGGGGTAVRTGAGQAAGYMGLLQTQQNIRNLQQNVESLQVALRTLSSYQDANQITQLQVEQTRQALFDSQSRLLTLRTGYESTLDNFKLALGLPPQLCVEIKDSMLDQFNLISRELFKQQNTGFRLQEQIGETLLATLPPLPEKELDAQQQRQDCLNAPDKRPPAEPAPADPAAREELPEAELPEAELPEAELPEAELPPPPSWDEIKTALERLRGQLNEAEQLRQLVETQTIPTVAEDVDRLEKALPERLKLLDKLEDRFYEEFQTQQGTLQGYRKELASLPQSQKKRLAQIAQRVKTFGTRLRTFHASIDAILKAGPNDKLDEQLREEIRDPVPECLRLFVAELYELTFIQARARVEAVELMPVDLSSELAYQIAMANRRDWKNARAALVNAWRLITFNANDLKAGLDVILEGDMQNVGDNPLDLRGSTGRLRARLEFDAPLTRLSERNTYRQALIEYQQARRNFYAFQDNVARSLRDTLRTIELNKLNFEIRRRAVAIAVSQFEQARLQAETPRGRVSQPRQRAPGQPPPDPEAQETLGSTTARDLIDALNAVLQAQDDVLSVWVNYEVLRRKLDLDLGTMQLTPEGLWFDPGPISKDSGFLMPADCPDCLLEFEMQLQGPLPETETLPPGEAVQANDPGEALPAEEEPPVPGEFPDLPAPLEVIPRRED